jgi:hypothetical protein
MANISEINGYLINAESASYATTASFALNGGGGAAFPFTGSAIITGSLVVTGSTTSTLGFTGSFSGSFTGSLFGTASWATNALNAVSSSYAATASLAPNYVLNSATSSFVTNAQTSSFVLNSQTGSFATTGSNIFKANQTISGSLIVTGSIIVTGSVSASAFNFGSSSLTQSRALLDNTFSDLNINGLTPNVRDRSSLLRVYGTYTTGSANTTGQNHILAAHIYPTFNPTNNSTSTFNTLTLEPQFLNTSATGSARGLYITPGFAGFHPNWRSIEWDNTINYGWGLYGAGSAPNYLAGNLSIGTLSTASALNVAGNVVITNGLTLTGSLNVSGSITGSLFGTASFASTASFYSGLTTTTFVGHCNSFTIPNGSLFYGAYLGGTPVTPPNLDTRTGSLATSFFPGYPMPAGTASNLTLVLRTTQSSNNTSFAYIANANSAITGSVITLAAGTAAGIYSSSANPVSFAQGDRLTVILSNPFVAGSSGSGNITTFRFTYQNV